MKRSKWFAVVLVVFLLFSGCSFPDEESKKDAVNSDISTREPYKRDQSSDTKNNRDAARLDSDDTAAGSNSKTVKQPEVQTALPVDNKQEVKSASIISDKELLRIVLYYQDTNRNIVPVSRKVEKQEGIAKAAINGLIDDPVNREEFEYFGIFPVLPRETQVLGIDVKQGVATIDFNSKLLNYKDEMAEKNIFSSITYTLTSFKTIRGVKVLIDGKPQGKLRYGVDLSGTLTRENVLVNSTKINLGSGLQKLDIYLFKTLNDKTVYILPVSVEVQALKPGEEPIKLVELLTKDYTSKKLYTQLPLGTKLMGCTQKGSTLSLDFNGELRNYGGTAREDALVKQILYTMRQIKGVEKVKILVNGKDTVLPEGTEVSKELSIPTTINEFVEE